MKGLNMIKAGRQIVAGEGAGALLTGFGPTAVGYLVQGGAKFAGYEFFKKTFVDLSGGPDARHRPPHRHLPRRQRHGRVLRRHPAVPAGGDAHPARVAARLRHGPDLGLRAPRPRGGVYGASTRASCRCCSSRCPTPSASSPSHEAAVEVIYRGWGPSARPPSPTCRRTGVELASGVVAGVAPPPCSPTRPTPCALGHQTEGRRATAARAP